MVKIIRMILPPLLLLATGVGVMLALGGRKQSTRDGDDKVDAPAVQTVQVEPYEGGLDIEVDGIVSPFKEISVAAEVGGRVIKKAAECQAGQFVSQGTLLIEIDAADYQLEYDLQQNQFEQATQSLGEIKTEKGNTQRLLDLALRDVTLREADFQRRRDASANAVSRSELDASEQAVIAAQNIWQTLENQLNSIADREDRLQIALRHAEIQRDRAELDRDRTSIRAPVDGVIIRDTVEQDGYVQKGVQVFTIEDTSAVEVQCSLKMDELYWLWRQPGDTHSGSTDDDVYQAYQIPRTPATVIYQFAGRKDLRYAWQGMLARYDGIGVDERTRTVPCRIVVDNPRDVSRMADNGDSPGGNAGPRALVRGMYVSVLIHAKPGVRFVKVPDEAIQPGKIVWRAADGQLERVGPVQLVKYEETVTPEGMRRGYWLTPTEESGLSAGDALVTTPLSGMRDGMEVSQ